MGVCARATPVAPLSSRRVRAQNGTFVLAVCLPPSVFAAGDREGLAVGWVTMCVHAHGEFQGLANLNISCRAAPAPPPPPRDFGCAICGASDPSGVLSVCKGHRRCTWCKTHFPTTFFAIF